MAITSSAYQRAVAAIDSVAWRGIMPGLERTHALLAALGEPQLGLRGVLVAGTNGKGSVCAVIDAVCRAAGLHTVLLTKPHLISYCERIVRDGRAIDEAEFATVLSQVSEAACALPEQLQPTGFEMLTAAGILVTARSAVDLLVCEVGMGGRLDSTNVLDPGVAVITNVALDHEGHLGPTVTDIAREKAAIIKRGNAAITAAGEPALRVIRERAASVAAELTVLAAGASSAAPEADRTFAGESLARQGVRVSCMFDGMALDVVSPLLGAHQIANLATAVTACDALRSRGFRIDADSVQRGCASVRWPGRMQWFEGHPPLLVDGAHNPAAMAAMVAAAREVAGDRRIVAVFGAMRDKDVAGMAAGLRGLTENVVLTAPSVERALPAGEMAQFFAMGAGVAGSTAAALREARLRAGPEGLVVVCGSLYLAGEVLSDLAPMM